ncbi:hypothetical protein [Actinoplanes sp. NPDC049316]|uniref:hypothetical protein n=1 Tax=Actinoplanes sp. NPDC049316 TaxID=3154727 RepID=UPI003420FC80
MVFTAAPEETFYPAQDRLVVAFQRWARQHRRTVDPFVVETLVEHRWDDGDGILCRWRPDELRNALLDWFPRKVSMPPGSWRTVVPTVHAFVDFLFAEDLADARCAEAEQLHAVLDGLVDDFDAAMGDQSRYDLAKFWAMRMLAADVDPTDSEAAGRYIAAVREGKIAIDQELLDQAVANHLNASGDAHLPPLPIVAVPDEGILAKSAAGSIALARIQRFVEWTGSGRTLTATGRLRLTDARELISLLDLADVVDPQIGEKVFKTKSSEELYETSVVFAWARAARVVRVAKGRLLPVKSAQKAVADPLSLAHRAFDGFFALGEAVCASGYSETMVRWRFDEVTFALLMAMYLAQDRVKRAELEETAVRVAEGAPLDSLESPHIDLWRDQYEHDVHSLLTHLALLAAITLTDGHAELTPLGTTLVAEHLRRQGADVPTMQDLLDETAEVVVAAAADAPAAVRDELLTGWCRRHPDTAAASLRALARRTDDRDHRKLAEAYARSARRTADSHLRALKEI